ncbi:hypothetical protein EVAR_27579_1 [Eumeta japonica]|uniref:Uncharacterized protein n=1 Tax=Eumeta variegata TaxID=151549 RepID=A0A4C1WCI5_EUMVA|nr:hypothetical protein EVAR_27579_1 [Eumeta japonica]
MQSAPEAPRAASRDVSRICPTDGAAVPPRSDHIARRTPRTNSKPRNDCVARRGRVRRGGAAPQLLIYATFSFRRAPARDVCDAGDGKRMNFHTRRVDLVQLIAEPKRRGAGEVAAAR